MGNTGRLLQPKMRRTAILIMLSAFLLAVVSLLTLHLYYQGTGEVVSQFQEHQLSYAKHLSTEIRFFFHARARDLSALSSLLALHDGEPERQRQDIGAYGVRRESVYVTQLSFNDGRGRTIYSTDPGRPPSSPRDEELNRWARVKENKGSVRITPASAGSRPLMFVLTTPVYRREPDGRQGPFAGLLSLTVDMKAFLAARLGASGAEVNLNQIWIVDKDGTLLFQLNHPEMVLRNIYREEGSCRSCHISFDYVESMLSKRQGTADYTIRRQPKKIAAFAPMDFEKESWIVVVNTSYARVTSFVRRSLPEHLFLLGLVLLAFASGAVLVIRKERMKIRAEDEAVRWREKMEERRKAEEALQLERNKLKAILDAMSDGVYIVNREREIVYSNPVIEKKYGPVRGRKCYEYLRSEGEVCACCRSGDVFSGATVRSEWCSRKTGTSYDLFHTPLMGPDGITYNLGIIRDITERKQAEEALRQSEEQLRQLSTQLLTAQETERKRISRELHDELGQALTVMKLHMNFIEKNLSRQQGELRTECEKGVEYIDQVIENVRRLSRDLSPIILEDFGLSAAIRWLINNFAKRHNIKVALDMIDIDGLICNDSRTIVYRIVQEVLTNIGKHSHAGKVSVSVVKETNAVSFSIEDDGRGFDPTETRARGPEEKGLGLETMRGRTQMLGGTLAISAERGKGTRIMVSIPINHGGH